MKYIYKYYKNINENINIKNQFINQLPSKFHIYIYSKIKFNYYLLASWIIYFVLFKKSLTFR